MQKKNEKAKFQFTSVSPIFKNYLPYILSLLPKHFNEGFYHLQVKSRVYNFELLGLTMRFY